MESRKEGRKERRISKGLKEEGVKEGRKRSKQSDANIFFFVNECLTYRGPMFM